MTSQKSLRILSLDRKVLASAVVDKFGEVHADANDADSNPTRFWVFFRGAPDAGSICLFTDEFKVSLWPVVVSELPGSTAPPLVESTANHIRSLRSAEPVKFICVYAILNLIWAL